VLRALRIERTFPCIEGHDPGASALAHAACGHGAAAVVRSCVPFP